MATADLFAQRVEIDRKIRELEVCSDPDPWVNRPYHESVKRALVVAAVSHRTIAVIGPPENFIAPILAGGARLGAVPAFYTPCPCGFLGDPRQACRCSLSAVKKHAQRIPRADLWVQAAPIPAREIQSRHKGTPLEGYQSRIDAARSFRPSVQSTLDQYGESLLRSAVSELAITPEQARLVIAITADIAALDQSPNIRSKHLAEAIQYRPRRLNY